jgi:hypothetical protein
MPRGTTNDHSAWYRDRTVMQCLRCKWTDNEATECLQCKTPTITVYMGGNACRECATKTNSDPKRFAQTYTVQADGIGSFEFLISRAQELCSDAHVVEVPVEHLYRLLQVNITEPRHYAHVDPAKPGIVATIEFEGRSECLLALIDGSHRAARCLIDGIPFRAYVLDWQLAHQCLLSYEPAAVGKGAPHA